MKFVIVVLDGCIIWGIVEGDLFFDIGFVFKVCYVDLKVVVVGNFVGVVEVKSVVILYLVLVVIWFFVILNFDKIFCVGLNYEMYWQEMGWIVVENLIIFVCFVNSQIGYLVLIVKLKVFGDFDYEGEFVVIIGKFGCYILCDDVFLYVVVYFIYNDGSICDYQCYIYQFMFGKNFFDIGVFGLWMMILDEFGFFEFLCMQIWLNGQVVQDVIFGMMIFDVLWIIEYCLEFICFELGDVIVIGMFGGVGVK